MTFAYDTYRLKIQERLAGLAVVHDPFQVYPRTVSVVHYESGKRILQSRTVLGARRAMRALLKITAGKVDFTRPEPIIAEQLQSETFLPIYRELIRRYLKR